MNDTHVTNGGCHLTAGSNPCAPVLGRTLKAEAFVELLCFPLKPVLVDDLLPKATLLVRALDDLEL